MSHRSGSHADVVVVGAGPNGLAAALTCAEAGRSVLVLEAADTIGGGARTAELTLPGFHHDVCSAIHPLAAVSPFFAAAGLDRYGLELVQPDIALVHPLDGGRAGVFHQSVAETAAGLGVDGRAWDRHIGSNLRAPFILSQHFATQLPPASTPSRSNTTIDPGGVAGTIAWPKITD